MARPPIHRPRSLGGPVPRLSRAIWRQLEKLSGVVMSCSGPALRAPLPICGVLPVHVLLIRAWMSAEQLRNGAGYRRGNFGKRGKEHSTAQHNIGRKRKIFIVARVYAMYREFFSRRIDNRRREMTEGHLAQTIYPSQPLKIAG